MTDRDALRSALGRVGIWSFALQAHPAAEERSIVAAYEKLGYGATWYPESVGSKEAFAHASILLAGSERMVVASGIANIYARDPMAMASGAATLAEAYPGRFVLGIGVSHAPSVAARGSPGRGARTPYVPVAPTSSRAARSSAKPSMHASRGSVDRSCTQTWSAPASRCSRTRSAIARTPPRTMTASRSRSLPVPARSSSDQPSRRRLFA